MYPKICEIKYHDGEVPYQAIIELVVSFSKYYYEDLLPKLFEYLTLPDFRLREIALQGLFRFYSTYNVDSFKYD